MSGGTITFQDVLSTAQTGDLVLFHGTQPESIGVELLTGGPYSHASMVVVLPNGDKALWQAAGEELEVDPVKGIKHTGAQLGALGDTISLVYHHWNDVPHFRRLVWNRPSTLPTDVLAFVNQLEERPFPQSAAEMLLVWEAGKQLDMDLTKGNVFCSELVAMTYQAIGLLPSDPVANSYSPNDFSSVSGHMVLQLGATFDDDVAIDVSTIPPVSAPTSPSS